MVKFIFSDTDRCTGCGLCEIICSWHKEGVFNPLKSRIRTVRLGFADIAAACRMCEDPPCVPQCPSRALTQREDGVIEVDEERCDGCGWCAEVCPYGAINIHPKKTALICDMCGGDPECIKACPTDALILVSQEEIPKYLRKDLMEIKLGDI